MSLKFCSFCLLNWNVFCFILSGTYSTESKLQFLLLFLTRDPDGRMLLDIFDENLHPLSVITFLCFMRWFSDLFLLLSGGSHLKTSCFLEIRSATRLWQTQPRAKADLPVRSDTVQCCSTDSWMCHCHPGECDLQRRFTRWPWVNL